MNTKRTAPAAGGQHGAITGKHDHDTTRRAHVQSWPEEWVRKVAFQTLEQLEVLSDCEERWQNPFKAARAIQRALFDQGHPDPQREDPEVLEDLVEDWDEEVVLTFAEAWSQVRCLTDNPVQFAIERSRRDPSTRPKLEQAPPRLRELCEITAGAAAWLSEKYGDFYMSCREVGEALGYSHHIGAKVLEKLRSIGILEVVEKATRYEATVYRCVMPEPNDFESDSCAPRTPRETLTQDPQDIQDNSGDTGYTRWARKSGVDGSAPKAPEDDELI